VAIGNDAAINIGGQVPLSYIDLHCFRNMPKSAMQGHKVGLFFLF
jgi:hypothetical protein